MHASLALAAAIADAAAGLYNGLVQFADGERKFSTFYPVGCSIA